MPARDRYADLTERILYLRTIPLVASLSQPVLKIVANAARDETFAPGEYLMREGRPVDSLHLILSGRVTMTRKGKLVGTLYPPHSVGLLDVLARGDGSCDAMADDLTTSLAIDAEALMEMMEDHFELLRAVVRYLCEGMLVEMKALPAGALGSRLAGELFDIPDRELDLVERMVFLRRLTGFRAANLNSIAMLARHVSEVRCPAGERFWSIGDAANLNLFVMRGTVRCTAADGRVWSAGPGNAIGGIEGVAHQPRWYSLEAETDFVGLWLAVASFERVLDDDFGLAQTFIGNVSGQLVSIMERRAVLAKSMPPPRPSGSSS